MRGFAGHVAPGGDGYLMLVGPSVKPKFPLISL
jgi:hypothetical protein